jgi:hypothetical protein
LTDPSPPHVKRQLFKVFGACKDIHLHLTTLAVNHTGCGVSRAESLLARPPVWLVEQVGFDFILVELQTDGNGATTVGSSILTDPSGTGGERQEVGGFKFGLGGVVEVVASGTGFHPAFPADDICSVHHCVFISVLRSVEMLLTESTFASKFLISASSRASNSVSMQEGSPADSRLVEMVLAASSGLQYNSGSLEVENNQFRPVVFCEVYRRVFCKDQG